MTDLSQFSRTVRTMTPGRSTLFAACGLVLAVSCSSCTAGGSNPDGVTLERPQVSHVAVPGQAGTTPSPSATRTPSATPTQTATDATAAAVTKRYTEFWSTVIKAGSTVPPDSSVLPTLATGFELAKLRHVFALHQGYKRHYYGTSAAHVLSVKLRDQRRQ